jgi:hypothetical protein
VQPLLIKTTPPVTEALRGILLCRAAAGEMLPFDDEKQFCTCGVKYVWQNLPGTWLRGGGFNPAKRMRFMKTSIWCLIFFFTTLGGEAKAWQDHNAPDSSSADSSLSAASEAAFERFQRRIAFLESYFLNVSASTFDTTLSFRVTRNRDNALGLSAEELSRIPAGIDRLENWISERNTGNSPSFNVGALLAKAAGAIAGKSGSGKRPRRLQVIPSENEIRVLKTLWTEKKATGSDIYRNMDSVRVTAAGLEEVLAGMANRGLVRRKQVSPRNEFTIATPFGGIPIEMSALNRKNREFVYEPTIGADDMWSYLDASLFNLQNPVHGPGDGLLAQHLRRLMQIFAAPAE